MTKEKLRIPVDQAEAEYIRSEISEIDHLTRTIPLKLQALEKELNAELAGRRQANTNYAAMKLKPTGGDIATIAGFSAVAEDGRFYLEFTPKPAPGLSAEEAATQKAAALAEANKPAE